jgi:hypothetical protein
MLIAHLQTNYYGALSTPAEIEANRASLPIS